MSIDRLYRKIRNSENLHAISLKYSGILFMFVLQVLLIKISSVSQYGIYISFLAVCNIIGTTVAFGQLTYLTKYIAISISQRASDASPAIFLKCSLVIFSFIYAILLIFSGIFEFNVRDLPIDIYFYLLVFFISTLRILSGTSRGLGLAITELAHTNITKPSIQAFSVITMYLLADNLVGAPDLIYSLLITNGAVCFLMVTRVSSRISPKQVYSAKIRIEGLKKQISDSLPLALLNIITAIEKNIDLIIVSFVLGPHSAGIYGFISRLYRLSNVAQSALNIVFGSKAAKAFSKRNINKLKKLTNNVILINTINSLFFLILLFFTADFVLKTIEPDLVLGKTPLLILLSSAVIRSLFGPVSMTANMTGNQKSALNITIFTLIFGSTIIFLLTSLYGLLGTACGVSILSISRAMLLRIMLIKRVRC